MKFIKRKKENPSPTDVVRAYSDIESARYLRLSALAALGGTAVNAALGWRLGLEPPKNTTQESTAETYKLIATHGLAPMVVATGITSEYLRRHANRVLNRSESHKHKEKEANSLS